MSRTEELRYLLGDRRRVCVVERIANPRQAELDLEPDPPELRGTLTRYAFEGRAWNLAALVLAGVVLAVGLGAAAYVAGIWR